MMKIKLKKLSLKKLKEMSKDDWQELLINNMEILFIFGQIILLLVLFRFRTVERGLEYEVPDVQVDPAVENVFPNPAYEALIQARDFDFMESPLADLGTKNIFDYRFVQDPQMLEEQILEWEERARTHLEAGEYEEALNAVDEMLLLNPYREASLQLQEQIQEEIEEEEGEE